MNCDKTIRIMALAPGAKHLGYAVLDGQEILYHGVRAYADKLSTRESVQQARTAIEEIFGHLNPSVLVIVCHPRSGSTRQTLLSAVIRELKDLAHVRRLPVLVLAPSTIRKFVCGDGRTVKRIFCRKIARRYPELRFPYFRLCWWKEDFQGHLFDAVGAGLLALKQLLGMDNSR